MADVYRDWTLYNVGKAIKNWTEYPFDWTMLSEYNQLNQQYIAYQWDMATIQANLRTSIQNKWVTVPASAAFNTYPSYVDQIDTTWWVPWIVWSTPVRSMVKSVWNYQERYHMLWYLSYSVGEYLFVVACYSWLTRDNYDQYVISIFKRKRWDSDYVETSTGISNSGLEDHRCMGIKVNQSWNILTFETCTERPTAGNNEYYWHHTQTFDMSTDTRWSWAEESYYGTGWNPYFSWNENDQLLYTVDLEPTRWSATVVKFTPNV